MRRKVGKGERIIMDFSLILTEESSRTLKNLSEQTGLTKEQIMSNGVSMYLYLLDRVIQDECEVFLSDGEELDRVMLL